MATEAWEVGQRCFTADGREGSFVAKTDDGAFVIHTHVEAYDGAGETVWAEGPMVVVAELFRKAPVEKLETTVAALRVEIDGLEKRRDEIRREVLKLHSEKTKATSSLNEALEEARQHEALRNIIDLASGKFEFAVQEFDSAPYAKIVERQKNRNWHNQRVATLEAASNGKLKLSLYRWQYSPSSYGSESITAMGLYETREQAQQAVVEIMASKQRRPDWLEAAAKLGIEITGADRAASHEYERKGAASRLEYTEAERAKAAAALAAIDAAAPAQPAPTPNNPSA